MGHHTPGRVIFVCIRVLPLWRCGTERGTGARGGARTCEERGGTCLRMPRAAARKHPASCRCVLRPRGGVGDASGYGGGHGPDGQGDGGGGLRDADRKGSRGTKHLFVPFLIAFL